MDLHVEKQYLEQIKEGKLEKFLFLYDEYFDYVYKYVLRRVGDFSEVEKMVKLTFLDALTKVQETSTESNYLVFLYGAAKDRVWNYLNEVSRGNNQGLIVSFGRGSEDLGVENQEVLKQAEKMFGKLSLEESEILRLKFFEDLADYDVNLVLGGKQETIGPKMYRVLKRVHFLLFGESDNKQGVYFGELSGFMSRVKELEYIDVPTGLKLNFRAELLDRIQRKEGAVEGEVETVVEEPVVEPIVDEAPSSPFNAAKEPVAEVKPVKQKITEVGSDDPAKIFVEAVSEMKEEEALKKVVENVEEDDLEQKEAFFEIFDKWKVVFAIIPIILFVVVVVFVVFSIFADGRIKRGIPTNCELAVNFEGEYSFSEKRDINEGINDGLCDHFVEIERLAVSGELKDLNVELDDKDWLREYKYAQKNDIWYIKYYAKTPNSDEESRKISRNS
jgi:RNA polymerase sigma-70 factor, ECF subfamily